MPNPGDPSSPKYLVRNQGAIQGSFPKDFIEALILSGIYSVAVTVQDEGSGSWVAFNSELERVGTLIR